MLAGRLQLHEVDDVDHADFQPGQVLAQDGDAASVSSVGTSPHQAMTTSGATARLLLAHCQMPMPSVQCLTAASIVSHCGVQRRYIHPKQEGDPEHAFVADQAHFHAGAATDRCYQRNKAFRGKVDVENALAGIGQDLGKRQFDRFAACQKSLTVLAG